MAPGQRLLDRRLRRAETIEGTVKLVLGDLREPQHRAQRMRSRRPAQLARRRKLRRRLDHAGDDQRQGQLGKALRPPRQQPIETQLTHHPEGGDDMSMRQRPLDLDPLRRNNHRLAAQHPPQRLHLGVRPVREVGERAGLHLAALAPALAQEYGGRRRAVRHARDVHEPHKSCYDQHVKQKTTRLHAYIPPGEKLLSSIVPNT
jgi:hypothetical protein